MPAGGRASSAWDMTTYQNPEVDQILLPGQAHAAPGPLDMTMMYAMHHGFRRDLRLLEAAAATTPADDRRAWVALGRRWRRFVAILRHHHEGEDAGYWPLLAARVDADERADVFAMEAEHHAMDDLLRAIDPAFHRLVTTASTRERATLAADVTRLRALVENHLRHEETVVIPLLHKHITVAEDEQIEREHFRSGLSLADLLGSVPWVLHDLPSEVRDRILAAAGPPIRMVWLGTRGRFARDDAAIRRRLHPVHHDLGRSTRV